MKIEVDLHLFKHLFGYMNREADFDEDALEALYNYYSEDEDFEVDVLAICGNWTQYTNEGAMKSFPDCQQFLNLMDYDSYEEVPTAFIAEALERINHLAIVVDHDRLLISE